MEFAVAESRDQGKPVSLASTVDIPRYIFHRRLLLWIKWWNGSASMFGVSANRVHTHTRAIFVHSSLTEPFTTSVSLRLISCTWRRRKLTWIT
jgi:hypothetical protein